MSAEPSHPPGPLPGLAPLPAVALPEVAVPSHVFVLGLPVDPGPHHQRRLLESWIALDPALRAHRDELAAVLRAASGPPQVGEVAVFLTHRDVGGALCGDGALLSLELVDPIAGAPPERAAVLGRELRRAATSMGHGDGLAQVDVRESRAGVPAVRARFFGLLAPAAGEPDDAASAPIVEACRWLFPVPGHPDLVWSVYLQTADLTRADGAIQELDELASSLRWAEP